MNISDMAGFWKTLGLIRDLRNQNMRWIEKYFYFMGGLLCLLALIMAIQGGTLVKHDFIINGRMGFERMRAALNLFIGFLCFFVFAVSMFTIALTAKP